MFTSRRGAASSALADAGSVALNFVTGVAKVYSLLVLLLYIFQRKLIFLPNGPVADPRARGGNPEVIVLQAGTGPGKHAAVFFKPKLPDAPVLVYFHGNADQLGYGASFLGSYFMARHDVGLYGIEYPGYGLACPGSPSEASIYDASEAMLRHLIDDLGVADSRIVLFGQSIGCAVAVEMARRGFGRRLVLLSPFTNTADMACEAYFFLSPVLKVAPFLVRDRFDNVAKAPGIGVPSLVIHGKEDEIVPVYMGAQLAKLIPHAQFLPVPHMGHNDSFDREDVLQEVAAFAKRPQQGTDRMS